MMDLAVGYYNEHSTMVGDRFVKVDFLDCGPYLQGDLFLADLSTG